MNEKRVADVMVSVLAEAGVKRIYGLIGDSLNPIGDAVRLDKRIDWIGMRHEECAAFAASAEAYINNSLCVCAGTAGPGSIHLINGLYEATRNRTPVLAIVTDFVSSETGLDYFQATTPMRLYEDCSVFCERLSTPSQMPRLFNEAIQAAKAFNGAAVIIVPKDVSEAPFIEADSLYLHPDFKIPQATAPDFETVSQMAEIINSYKNITLYCGMGCRDAVEEIFDLADTLKAPTVCTLRSKDFMAVDNPFNVGMNGPLSSWESKYALDNCNLLILLGVDFHGKAFYPKQATVIQVDIAGKNIGRRSRLDFGVVGDVRLVLQSLKPLLKANSDNSHLEKSLEAYRQVEDKNRASLEEMRKKPKLRPELLTSALSELADYNAVFIVDVGLANMWAARYINPAPNRILTGSFKHGTMGAAVGEGIGAHFAAPERQIIVIAGDGGLTMLFGELLTVIQYRIPLKIVVYNNSEFGFINLEAETEGFPPFATALKNPDFAAIASLLGFKSVRIDNPDNLEEKLKNILAEDGPVLIEAVTDSSAIGTF